jgi:hypothetical protein
MLLVFFALSYFSDRVSYFSPNSLLPAILPISASQVASITGVSYLTQLEGFLSEPVKIV